MTELKDGLVKGYIDRNVKADEGYVPKILVNNYKKNEKVLAHIEYELKKCEEFYFSVAFITDSGVLCLINSLCELERKGIKGIIITSQYQNFTTPSALKKLMKFKNIELRIVLDNNHMHAKGYIFKRQNEYSMVIGSSNLTQSALGSNMEWNVKLNSSKSGKLIDELKDEFNDMYNVSIPVDDEFLTSYTTIYDEYKRLNKKIEVEYNEELDELYQKAIQPNSMQKEALERLNMTRQAGKRRALIISATGTGKTFLAAFDVKNINPKKFLFVVHRETIAKAALKSFKKILGRQKSMAVLSGNNKNIDADYIFATIQTLSKPENYQSFNSKHFDYIAIDEVHRAGAQSYNRILKYFEPQFLLGMSATPERTDDFDVYGLFDYNVPFEIRLNRAMQEELICPFHYFGVSEIKINDDIIDDNADFSYLTSDERVKNIIEKADLYGYSGTRVRGLIFCSRKEEAKELSNKMNKLGYITLALSGEDSQDVRERAMLMLEADERLLDYIFTVDIFNEGVDIPMVNQIIMLRPTQSAIIFVQQLGRGLRKAIEKEYVTVIDFIGNYKHNYLIPIALSGDTTYNKDNIRKYICEGSKFIPGASTINFDEITRERIFQSIDATNFGFVKLIKESYFQLKQRLGRIPSLNDFESLGSVQTLRIFEKFDSYHEFLMKYEKDYDITLTELEGLYIKFISCELADGKKPHELIIIKLLMEHMGDISMIYCDLMARNYHLEIDINSLICSCNILLGKYLVGTGKDKYKGVTFIEDDFPRLIISEQFKDLLENKEFKKQVNELLEFGLNRNKKYYGERYMDTNLTLYAKYTYNDVCRLLNWYMPEVALNIGGYKYNKDTKTFPVFINYKKNNDINNTIKYDDRFISSNKLIALSKSNRTVKSEDIKTIYNSQENNVDIMLFMRKDKEDKESQEFYFLGKMKPIGAPNEKYRHDAKDNVVEITYELFDSVNESLYDYIVN